MIDQNQNIQFKLNSELIGHVQGLIGIKDDQSIKKLFNDFHYADIAEILNELNTFKFTLQSECIERKYKQNENK